LAVLALWLCAIPWQASAQEAGKPFIRNYSYKEYLAHPQNFAIVQDPRGVMYVANYGGLLEYDGTAWRHITLPNHAYVEGLLAMPDGRIYIGGNDEAGYLAPDPKGAMQYFSLIPQIQEHTAGESLNFSRIVAHGDSIIFVDPFTLFVLYDGKITATPHTTYGTVASIGGQLYLPNDAFQLSVQQAKGKLAAIAGSQALPDNSIAKILPTDYGQALLVYEQFLYALPLPLAPRNADSDIKPRRIEHPFGPNGAPIRDAVYLGNGLTALATAGQGVVFIDSAGRIARHITKDDGLKDNYVWGLCQDSQNSLWMALDNGIARTAIEPDFTYWDDSRGLKGYVSDIIRYNDRLYVGTGSGFFKLEDDGQFRMVKGGNLETYRMCKFIIPGTQGESILLLGGIWGVFQLENDGLKQLEVGIASASAICQSSEDSSVVYLGNGDLHAIRYERGKWVSVGHLDDVAPFINNIEEERGGALWIKTPPRELVRVQVKAPGALSDAELMHYSELVPPPSQDGVNLLRLPGGEVLFGAGQGLFRFKPGKIGEPAFAPSEFAGPRYQNAFFSINKMALGPQRQLWVSATYEDRHWVECVAQQSTGEPIRDSISFVKLYNTYIECIYPETAGTVWFGGPDGLFRYNAHAARQQPKPYPCLIKRVVANKDSVLFQGFDTGKDIVLPYRYNNMAMAFTLPSYVNEEATQFNYRLVGYDRQWSGWGSERKKEYTNLPERAYRFEVKARDAFGQETEVASIDFTIEPPLYRTWYAYGSYALAAVALIFLAVKWQARRLIVEKERLERIVEDRTREIVLKNAELEQQKEEILTQAENLREANEDILQKHIEIEKQQGEIVAQRDVLAEQNREIVAQRDKLEQAYNHVTVLSEIGQSITAHLRVEGIIDTVYHSVNSLMDATGFGIGIYNQRMNRLDFPGYIEKGDKLPFHFNALAKIDSLAAWAFLRNDEVFINDYDNEVGKYLARRSSAEPGDEPTSIIYLPLKSHGKPIGVITVQSFEPNAYSRYQLDMLRNISIYTGIALENASVYQEIAKQNRKITDSINYAQHIQQAMLPPISELEGALPDAFVLFQPRDIVSGDFYWMARQGDITVVAAVDCTGHGVPGAFMSLVGDGFLKQLVTLRGLTDPAEILGELHELVREALHQKDGSNRDGMDMAVCCVDEANRQLLYAGARNPLVAVHPDKGLQLIKANRQSIGGHQQDGGRYHFDKHVIPLNGQTMFYLFSDGFKDQFGGEQGGKLTSKNFYHLLGSIAHLPGRAQQGFLASFIRDWVGKRSQIDDILVLGFRA
jgi:serine phosphatase RsbU (regulator of sigma subunit)/ligand-binding sensor domain-containing protein